MGFQTENRTLVNKVNAVQNRQVESFDRIERLEERAEHLAQCLRAIEERLVAVEKVVERLKRL